MLGARIASLRRSAGLAQADLAQCLNVSPSAIGMYEQGRREPSFDILIAISQKFGVTTDYLITGRICTVNDLEALSSRIKDSRRALCAFSDDELTAILTTMLTKNESA